MAYDSRKKEAPPKASLKRKSGKDYTLIPTAHGPANGVHFNA